MKRIASLALAAIVAFCLIFLGGTSVKAQGGSTSSTTSTSWTGPGEIVWNWGLNIESLTTTQRQYSEYGSIGEATSTGNPVVMPNGVQVKPGYPLGYADTWIMLFSTDGGASWQGVPANQVAPPPASDPNLGPLISNVKKDYHYNSIMLFLVDPHVPRVYLMGGDGVDLLPLFVGSYSNEGFAWQQQTEVWTNDGSAFDPQYPNVIYSAQVLPTTPGKPELKTAISIDGGYTWTPIPIPSQLEADNFTVMGVERSTNGTTLLLFALPPNQPSPGQIWQYPVNTTIFIPDSAIQDPSLMTVAPVTLSLKIGSPELVITKSGTRTTVALDVKPIVLDGRTMLPIRPIVEALGGTISYSDGVVTIAQGPNSITLRISDNVAVVNGQNTPIDANPAVKPFIIPPGRTMLPLRFVAEALGAQVNYLGAGNISIIYPNPSQ